VHEKGSAATTTTQTSAPPPTGPAATPARRRGEGPRRGRRSEHGRGSGGRAGAVANPSARRRLLRPWLKWTYAPQRPVWPYEKRKRARPGSQEDLEPSALSRSGVRAEGHTPGVAVAVGLAAFPPAHRVRPETERSTLRAVRVEASAACCPVNCDECLWPSHARVQHASDTVVFLVAVTLTNQACGHEDQHRKDRERDDSENHHLEDGRGALPRTCGLFRRRCRQSVCRPVAHPFLPTPQ
jgi:hypothetical protein